MRPMPEPLLPVPPSPTGAPRLPPALVPWLQLLYPVLGILGAEFALPGPWTPERYFFLTYAITGSLLGMASAGNRGRP